LTPAIDSAGKGNIVAGTVASAVVGGTASELGGGKFANGAQTAAFQYLFNARANRWLQSRNHTAYLRDQAAALQRELSQLAPGRPQRQFVGPETAAGFRVQINTLQRDLQVATQEMALRESMGISRSISEQKQDHHVQPSRLYGGGGYFSSRAGSQSVLNAFHSGGGFIMGRNIGNSQIFFHYGGAAGFNQNLGAGFINQTTNMFMIKGTSRVSVVPINPRWRNGL